MTENEIRQRFEAWFEASERIALVTRWPQDDELGMEGKYVSVKTQGMWEAFQAGAMLCGKDAK